MHLNANTNTNMDMIMNMNEISCRPSLISPIEFTKSTGDSVQIYVISLKIAKVLLFDVPFSDSLNFT